MKLEGDIGEIQLVEQLVELGREGFTGALRFENDGIIKILYFKSGDILSASTNDRADSVDEILMRAGKVSREHVKQALARRKENETLGDALLNLGFITKKELTWGRRIQAIGVIRSITNWTSGSFQIVPDYLPKREEGTLFPSRQIIVELLVTEPDRVKVERQVEGGDAVYTKNPEFDTAFRGLNLNEDAEAIVAQIDGKQSAADIANASGKDAFNTYKLLHALTTLGLLTRRGSESAFAPRTDEFTSAGVADAADMWTTEPELGAQPEPLASGVRAPFRAPTIELPLKLEDLRPEPEPELPPPPAPEPPPPPVTQAQIPTVKRPKIQEPPPEEIDIAPVLAAEPPGPIATPPPRRTARAASTPPLSKPKAKSSGGRFAVLIAIIVVAILGFAGYAGYMWWKGRSGTKPVIAQQTNPTPHPVVPPPVTNTPTTTTTNVNVAPASAGGTQTTPAPTQAEAGATSAGATSADPLRERYAAMAREFAANRTGKYTVQFELVCQTYSLTKAIEAGGDKIWFAPVTYRDKPCYRVFWGRFDTREAAQRGFAEIPAALRSDANPVVVEIPRG